MSALLDSTTFLLVLLVLAGIGGFFVAQWVRKQEESAPERALQGIDALLSAYERMMINQREKTEAEARLAANAARYVALQKRLAALPATPVLPSAVSVPAAVAVEVK